MDATRPGFETYLFDLDGTLVDSIDLIMASFRHTMRTHLGAVPPDAAWRAGFGRPLRTQLAAYASEQADVDGLVATYRAYNHEHHDRLVRPYPGIADTVATLRARGAALAIVTSKGRTLAWRGLARCGLDAHFTVLVGVDDVRAHKPDPAPVLLALDRLSAPAGGAVFVGDSPHDIRAGRAAGVSTAAVTWGPFPRAALAIEAPDHWLARPADIVSMRSEPLPGDGTPRPRPPSRGKLR